MTRAGWERMTWDERKATRTPVGTWWFLPTTNTRYRATAHLPKLFHDRMDEFGLDFSVVFPTVAIIYTALPGIQDDELRRACCRAYNMYAAELYGEFADRLTPAAAIPMHTPDEAIDELEYCVKQLHLKATMFPSYVVRPHKPDPALSVPVEAQAPYHMDLYTIDSDYDYDPVWAKCVELGVAPCFHSTAEGLAWGPRQSISNTMYNTIGNFAESGDAVAKALFMGGVTRRFPNLRFGFLEGGAGRGVLLYTGMLGFWEKRHPKAIMDWTDPRKLDRELMGQLIDEYGQDRIRSHKDEILQGFKEAAEAPPPDLANFDDWAGAQIERPEQFRELFESNFYYGCEADDPITVWAFNTRVNPFGARIRTIMGSDISHADVIDPVEVLPEAYELVEHGLLNDEEFREFVFTNAVRLYGGMNRHFFDGTPAESAAEHLLAEESGARP
jgi:predicted TIM-barrel fold metal-dependent hydrolase